MHNLISHLQRLNLNRLVLWCECTLLAVVAALYMYFIVMSVVQVVLRQELVVAIKEQETVISELEARYFAQLNDLSPETAVEYDLVAVAPYAYVEVEPASDRLTLVR